MSPWRIVIGEVDKKSGDVLYQFLLVVYRDKFPPFIRTAPVNAELIKYTSNAFLAMRVSFINTIARLYELIPNSDVNVVAYGVGLDPKICTQYLKAGPGFGGICLPKDLRALIRTSERIGYDPVLLEAIYKVNDEQMRHVVKLVEGVLGGLMNKDVAVLGLAFKADIDDVRESPAIRIVNYLIEKNARVKVYDPLAMENAKNVLGNKVVYASSMYECIKNCDAVIIVTDWSEFKRLTFKDLKKYARKPIIIDTKRIPIDKINELHEEVIYVTVGVTLPPNYNK